MPHPSRIFPTRCASLTRRIFLGAAGVSVIGTPFSAFGQSAAGFPSRRIKFIVPLPAGTAGGDQTARFFARRIAEITGQPVIVENKAGGNGFIGVQAVLNAPADGYTVFFGTNSTLSTNAATFKKLPYDPLTDFTPVSLIARTPCFIVVPATSKYHSLADLIADARKRPGALNYASGTMSYTLYTEWLNTLAKMRTTAVNYKGSSEAITDLIGGTIDFAVMDASGLYGLVSSGTLRALAFTADERSPIVPDIPSMADLGMPEYVAVNWAAAAVSAKTPPAIVEKLAALFAQAGADDEAKAFFRSKGSQRIMSSPAEMRRFQSEEIARWKRLMAVTGIEAQ